jgi:hypothetical protein
VYVSLCLLLVHVYCVFVRPSGCVTVFLSVCTFLNGFFLYVTMSFYFVPLCIPSSLVSVTQCICIPQYVCCGINHMNVFCGQFRSRLWPLVRKEDCRDLSLVGERSQSRLALGGLLGLGVLQYRLMTQESRSDWFSLTSGTN